MPPRGHSSSSHHSSHSSHHSSHSSHSSGSSYRSGPSTPTRKAVKKQVPRPERKRTNQPPAYNGKKAIHRYKCIHHDYVYYAEDWTDVATGVEYKKGYYDENGDRYDTVIIDDNGMYESRFDCIYCGTSTKEKWGEGAVPQCPNCGANLIESSFSVVHDAIDNSTVEKVEYVETVGSKINRVANAIVSVIVSGIAVCIVGLFFFVIIFTTFFDKGNDGGSSSSNSNVKLFGENIYVESIDRTLPWMDEYESYYDAVSDCYVWYNTDVEPAVWQYWYEDISSDFGDYGWMEYELDEAQWYIERGMDDWILLPSKYDTSKLWYITGDLAGTSYSQDANLENFGNYIMIDGYDTQYEWDSEMLGYRVNDQNCYIRVNFDVKKPSIQYWYNSISNKYTDDGRGGWLEFDADEECWYISDANDEWNPIHDGTDSLWYVHDSITGQTGAVYSVNGQSTFGSDQMTLDDKIFIDYPYDSFLEHTISLDVANFRQGDGYADMLDGEYVVGPEVLGDITTQYVLPHKDEVVEFFEAHKNDPCNASEEVITDNICNVVGETMDVTDWFDSSITITDADGKDTHVFRIDKAELAIARNYYYGDKMVMFDEAGQQQKTGDIYIYVEGVRIIFTTK